MNEQNTPIRPLTPPQADVTPMADPTPTPSATTQKRRFSPFETVFAYLCFFFGYGFFRAFPVFRYPLGGMLLLWALFLSGICLLKLQKHKIPPAAYISFAGAYVLSLSLFFSANIWLHIAAFPLSLSLFAYGLLHSGKKTLEKGFGDLIVMDFLRATVSQPLSALSSVFSALAKAKSGGKVLARILGGLLIALIPTAIVFSLLSYDAGFTSLFESLFDGGFDRVLSHLSSLVLGIPVAMYLFGLWTACTAHDTAPSALSAEDCHRTAERLHVFSPVTVCASVIPVLFLYVLFFISQWEYYVSAFTGALPHGTGYADYAREGFFELCTVSFINLCILTVTALAAKRKGARPHPAVRGSHILICLSTLILIATAMSKMLLYINMYGLTPKRVYTTWFMALLTVWFLLILVKQFVTRIPVCGVGLVVCFMFVAGLGLSNMDGRIAEYNVDRYLDGTLPTLDVEMLTELDDAAVPALVRAGCYETETDYELPDPTEKCSVFSYTLPLLQAREALEELKK